MKHKFHSTRYGHKFLVWGKNSITFTGFPGPEAYFFHDISSRNFYKLMWNLNFGNKLSFLSIRKRSKLDRCTDFRFTGLMIMATKTSKYVISFFKYSQNGIQEFDIEIPWQFQDFYGSSFTSHRLSGLTHLFFKFVQCFFLIKL